jgi:hypothetical protein
MKKPKTLYRYNLYEFRVDKYKLIKDDVPFIEMEKDIPFVRREKSILYRVVDQERRLDFCGFDNRDAAKREGAELLNSEIWRHQRALEELKKLI